MYSGNRLCLLSGSFVLVVLFCSFATGQCEDAILVSDAPVENAYFGAPVGISGSVAAIGEFRRPGGGAAYVFEYSGDSWTQIVRLTAFDAQSNASFGNSVAIFGDQMVVGSFEDDLAELEPIPGGEEAGSVYSYKKLDGIWEFQQKIVASDGSELDNFGLSVALSDQWLIVSAPFENNANGGDAGSVYVFSLVDGAWVETQKILASNGEQEQFFGSDIALSGNHLAVAAISLGEGSVYVFSEVNGTWEETANLTLAENNEDFGFKVALEANVVAVGNPGYAAAGAYSGAVHMFEFDGAEWIQTQTITASDAATNDTFGVGVALLGNKLLVVFRFELITSDRFALLT